MKKLFVSYAREDRGRIEPLVALLRDEGFDVFWDTTMPSGAEWPEFLDAQLASAQVLIVLWTPAAVASRWVRTEALEALQQGKLMPVRLDEVRPPFAFRQIHAFDLIGWQGDKADGRLTRLMAELHARPEAGLAPEPDVADAADVVPVPVPRRTGWHWLAAAAAALALAGLGSWTWPWFAPAPAPAPARASAPAPDRPSAAASAVVGGGSAPVSPTSQPPKPRPVNQKQRCDSINEQLRMGIPVSDADRSFLKNGC